VGNIPEKKGGVGLQEKTHKIRKRGYGSTNVLQLHSRGGHPTTSERPHRVDVEMQMEGGCGHTS